MFHGFKSIPHAQLYHMRRHHRGDRDPSRCASGVSIKLPGRLKTSFSIWMILRGRKLGSFSHFETKPTWVSVKNMWDMFDSIAWFLGCNWCRHKPITKLYMYIFYMYAYQRNDINNCCIECDIWYMMYDVLYTVYDICDIWDVTCDIWYMIYDAIRHDIYIYTCLTHIYIYVYLIYTYILYIYYYYYVYPYSPPVTSCGFLCHIWSWQPRQWPGVRGWLGASAFFGAIYLLVMGIFMGLLLNGTYPGNSELEHHIFLIAFQ
jgi:hypothetical protein